MWQQKETLLQKKSTKGIDDSLPVPVPPKKKKMKGREEYEMLEKVLPAFQFQVLNRLD